MDIEQLKKENKQLWEEALLPWQRVIACQLGICDVLDGKTDEEKETLNKQRLDVWENAVKIIKHNLIEIYNHENRGDK